MTEKTEATITVAGETINIDYEQLYSAAPEELPRMVAYWEAMLGNAEAERLVVDAEYRQWRAGFVQTVLRDDPKLSEWKMTAKIESNPGFGQWKQGLATCAQHIAICRGLLKAFELRAEGERG